MWQAGVLVALLLLAVLAYRLLGPGKSGVRRGDTVLLLGPVGSGKTVLLNQLRHGRFVETHTSMEENEGVFGVLCGPTGKDDDEPPADAERTAEHHYVDLPGHERLRSRVAHFAPNALAVVFVLDATSLSGPGLRAAAGFLYDVLANQKIAERQVPILILANKQDLPSAVPAERVRRILAKEVNKLRTTRTSMPESQDGQVSEVFLGIEGEDFDFAHIDTNQVSFAECSAGTGDLAQLIAFLQDLEA